MDWIEANWPAFVPWILFAVLYIATFKLAWRKLADLVVASATRRHKVLSWRFWWQFVEYRIILLAPYMSFVIFRKHVPTTAGKLIFWWVVLMIGVSALRFLKTDRLTKILWWIYGYAYDGLLKFYPYRNLIDTVVDMMKLENDQHVLEIGCGTGNVMQAALKRADVTVVGVDNSKSMLRRARKKLHVNVIFHTAFLVKSDALSYIKSLPDESFDRISMVNFLYAAQNRVEIWEECLRLIKPDGKIVTTTSIEGGSKPIIQEHLRNAPWVQLVSLRLLGVVIIDFFISELAKGGPFSFPEQQQLLQEVVLAGGKYGDVSRIYGGSEDGVNIVFSVERNPAIP